MTAPLLGRIQASNECWFHKLDAPGSRFRGVLQPVSPSQLPTSIFVLPRLSLRVRLQEPVLSGDMVVDPMRRVLLVADHDLALSANDPLSRVHALFQLNQQVDWKRWSQTVNPVTKQVETVEEPEDMGPIWASIESFTRTNTDPGTRGQTDRLRCITAQPLALNDVVFARTVKRVQYTLGVYVSEIE